MRYSSGGDTPVGTVRHSSGGDTQVGETLQTHRTQLGLGLKQSSFGGTVYPNVSKKS